MEFNERSPTRKSLCNALIDIMNKESSYLLAVVTRRVYRGFWDADNIQFHNMDAGYRV